MKSALMLTVILSLVAASARARAEEGKDQLVKLRARLQSPDPTTRAAATAALPWVEGKAAVGLLVKTLTSDPAADVRQTAAQALGQREARPAQAHLRWAARHDTSPAVKDAAVHAIRQIRQSSSVADEIVNGPDGYSNTRVFKRAVRDEPGYHAGRAKRGVGIALFLVGTLAGAVMGGIALSPAARRNDDGTCGDKFPCVTDGQALGLGIGAILSLGVALGVGGPLLISGIRDGRKIRRRARRRPAAGSVQLANGPGQAGLGLVA